MRIHETVDLPYFCLQSCVSEVENVRNFTLKPPPTNTVLWQVDCLDSFRITDSIKHWVAGLV
jgi:hypothetical protein